MESYTSNSDASHSDDDNSASYNDSEEYDDTFLFASPVAEDTVVGTTITIKLTDGICEIPTRYLNAFSESSFTICTGDIQSDTPLIFECDYLTKEECMDVVDVLRGRASISELSGRQHKFIDIHMLLPGYLSSIQMNARQT